MKLKLVRITQFNSYVYFFTFVQVRGSLARKALIELEEKGLIKTVSIFTNLYFFKNLDNSIIVS